LRWQAWHADGSPVASEDFPGSRALRGEVVVPGMEVLHTQEDGREVWTEVSAVPHRDDEGRVIGCITVITNIDILKRTKERLREADRRKSEFLAMLGHELRNPLTAVEGGLTLLQSPKARPESREAALPIVVQQVAHMKRLIDDLLDLARLERGKLQVKPVGVELGAILQASLQMTATLAAAKGSQIRYQPPQAAIRLYADAERLVQVFANLLANALKFSAPGSAVDVRAEQEGGAAIILVRDYGRGIAAEDLAEIFDPFVQSKQSLGLPEGGLGLGLAVSRELVELLGGKIAAWSEGLDKGSTFVVSLPLAPVQLDA
jgi:signal transduction histidine kinase